MLPKFANSKKTAYPHCVVIIKPSEVGHSGYRYCLNKLRIWVDIWVQRYKMFFNYERL